RRVTRPWCGIWRRRRAPRGHALGIVGVVLLLQVPCRVLRVGCTNSGANDRPGGRADPGAPTAANRATERRTKAGAKEGAADCLGIGLVAQGGDLRVR